MTAAERAIVRRAIESIMAEDDNFAGAMSDLCELVGWEYPAGRVRVRPASVTEMLGTDPNVVFVVRATPEQTGGEDA